MFDSGVGGLTVAAAVRQLLPNEDIVYLGDTARVPYGIKSAATVTQVRHPAGWLAPPAPAQADGRGVQYAECRGHARARRPWACRSSGSSSRGPRPPPACQAGRTVAVLATEATVNSGAYVRAIHAIDASVPVVQRSCPLFVPMAEEGRDSTDKLVNEAAYEYLEPIRRLRPGVVVLGCTHYPLLRDAIARRSTAGRWSSIPPRKPPGPSSGCSSGITCCPLAVNAGTLRCYATDNPERFRKIGTRFCGEPLEHVELVPLDDIVAMDLQLASP